MSKRLTWFPDFLLWLSGADRDVLRHCARERPKFVAMGGTVLTTSVLAVVAATFTANQFLHVHLAMALAIGCAWGLAIMNLDRWLLTSIRRQRTPRRTVLLALPRIGLALIVGFMIAEPIVLRVFEKEVHAQAVRDKKRALREGIAGLKVQYSDIPELERERRRLGNALRDVDASEVLDGSTAYQEALRRVEDLETRAATAGAEGREDVARGLRRQAHAQRRKLFALEQDLRERAQTAAEVAATADSAELAKVTEELEGRKHDRAADEADLRDEFSGEVGLLDRVEALGALTSTHPSMLGIRIMLLLFILSVDSLPAIAKVLMSLGEPSVYERVQIGLEATEAATVEHRAAAYVRASEIWSSLVVDEAVTRKELTLAEQEKLLRKAVAIMAEAGDKFLDGWRIGVMERVDDLVDAELRRLEQEPEPTT